MTFYGWVLMIGGYGFALFGIVTVALVIRSVRKRPARRPDPRLVRVQAGRVYRSRAAAGAVDARDRVVAPPVEEAGATTYLAEQPFRQGRHRMVGAGR